MTIKKSISLILKGALGLTLSFGVISNAHSALITTSSTNDNNVVTVDANNPDVSITDEFNESYYSYDLVSVDIFTGEVERNDFIDEGEDEYEFESQFKIGIYDSEYGTRSDGESNYEYRYAEIWSLSSNIFFSTEICYSDDSDFEGYNCLNKLDAGTVIDESWFDGTNGQASNYGTLYDESNRYESFGAWDEIGATGFVAFAYVEDLIYDDELTDRDIPDIEIEEILLPEVTYGFLEITRGSVIVHNIVTTASSASVPEPAGLVMFALGLFGLASRKLNKRTK